MFYLAYSKNELSKVSYHLLKLKKPEYLSVIATDDNIQDAFIDEYGVKYSKDGLRLLKAPKELKEYVIREGTKVICVGAFWHCENLSNIKFPNTIQYIGYCAFGYCYCNNFYQVKSVLEAIIVPHGQIIKFKELLKDAGCDLSIIKEDLANVVEDEFGVAYSRDGLSLLKASENIKKCRIEDGTAHICDWAFRGCSLLYEVIIPSSVRCIDFYAFGGCSSLREVFINSSMLSIKEGIFKDCKSLQSIFVPKGKTAKFRELLKNAGCDLSIIKEQDE